MAEYPPYMNAYGNIERILTKMKDAQTPDRFTHDYLETVLGFSGGSARPFVSFAKRLGLLQSDGAPTELYRRFRNASQSEQAMAEAIRRGYADLYKRNEYAHHLDTDGLEGLVVEITGLERDSSTLRSIVKSFETLKEFANFELKTDETPITDDTETIESSTDTSSGDSTRAPTGVRFSYTIYLNLPDTTDPAVFNAIFKALKENLL